MPSACADIGSGFTSEVKCEEYLGSTRDLFVSPVTVLQYPNDGGADCAINNPDLTGYISKFVIFLHPESNF